MTYGPHCNPCIKDNYAYLVKEAREHARKAQSLKFEYETLETKGFEAQAEADKLNKIAEEGFNKSEKLFRESYALYNKAELIAKDAQKYAEMAIECYKHACNCNKINCEKLEYTAKCAFEKSVDLAAESKKLKALGVKIATNAHQIAVSAHEFAVKSIEYLTQADKIQKLAEAETLAAAALYKKALDCYKGYHC